jgi:hypothetical protein
MRERVEHLTDEYFYRPWEIFTDEKLDDFQQLLENFREQLHRFGKMPSTE